MEAVWRFVRTVFLGCAFPYLRAFAISHFVLANASFEATYGHAVSANLRFLTMCLLLANRTLLLTAEQLQS